MYPGVHGPPFSKKAFQYGGSALLLITSKPFPCKENVPGHLELEHSKTYITSSVTLQRADNSAHYPSHNPHSRQLIAFRTAKTQILLAKLLLIPL